MTTRSSQFGHYFHEHLGDDLDPLIEQISGRPAAEATDAYRSSLIRALQVIAEGVASADREPVISFTTAISERRAREGISITTMLHVFDGMRAYVWDHLERYIAQDPGWQPADVRAVEDILYTYQHAYFGGFRAVSDEIRGQVESQQIELENQRALIQQISTPIVPLYAGILLVALVGSIDERRAAQMIESVLERIVQDQADMLIVDVTGVPLVDTSVANHMMMLIRAVRLLGAQVTLVGIGAEVAQTIVQLGIDMADIAIRANLQDGLVYALGQRGLSIRTEAAQAAPQAHEGALR